MRVPKLHLDPEAVVLVLPALMALALSSACQTPDAYETHVNLTEVLATAEIHREPGLVDLGTAPARAHLGSGWSWNEKSGGTSYVWGIGEASELRFFLSTARAFTLEIHCFPYPRSGGPAQTIQPVLNGSPLASLELAAKAQGYQFTVPEQATRAGQNRLVFEYLHSRPADSIAGNGDRRRLAVGWDWIRFHLDPEASLVEVNRQQDGFSMPFGSGVDFYFESDPGDRLVVDEIRIRDSETAGIEVNLQTDGSDALTLLALSSSRKSISIDLPVSTRQAARLSLRVPAQVDRTEPVILVAPRIERPVGQASLATDTNDSTQSLHDARRANLLIYNVDTLRADRLGLYGYERGLSPHLDRFGGDAVVFAHAMAQTSWTKPAVASIFTGLRTTAHGVNHRQHRLSEGFQTLAELLAAAGYQTAAIATNAYFAEGSGLRQGFDEFYLEPAPANRINELIFDWLDRRDVDQPFFLYVHTIDPHAPYEPPDRFRRRFAPGVTDQNAGSLEHIQGLASGVTPKTPESEQNLIDLYDAEVAFADEQFGVLLEALQTRQLYEDLVVVFLSDHGEGLYQHGILGHGWDLHREAIQIPLILRVPGLARGQRIEDPVQQIDLLPTLLDLLAIDDSESHQGRSLKPLLEGSYSEEDSDTPLLAYLDYEGRKGMSLILGPWKLIEPLSSSFSSGRQLFHRVRDPDERTNLASEYPVLAGYMASRVRAELLEFEKLSEPERMEFDEQTREELRALGYLQ